MPNTAPQTLNVLFEELQARVAEAQKHLNETTQRLQQVQHAHATAQQQFNIWNGAFQTVVRERQLAETTAQQNQLPLPGSTASEAPPIANPSEAPNKTAVIRDLLRDHPAGLTAGEMWSKVGGQFKYRAYFYNVLKRLRDRDEVIMRRNKYSIRTDTEVNHSAMVQ